MTNKRVYISFNRRVTDLDANNDQQFLGAIIEHVHADGGTPVGEELNDSMHLENIVKSCDEVWVCLRTWKRVAGDVQHELPGAMMALEQKMAEHLKKLVVVKHFIFDF